MRIVQNSCWQLDNTYDLSDIYNEISLWYINEKNQDKVKVLYSAQDSYLALFGMFYVILMLQGIQ